MESFHPPHFTSVELILSWHYIEKHSPHHNASQIPLYPSLMFSVKCPYTPFSHPHAPQASVPALIDLAAQLPAAKDGLAALLQQLLPTKASEPLVMNLVRGHAYTHDPLRSMKWAVLDSTQLFRSPCRPPSPPHTPHTHTPPPHTPPHTLPPHTLTPHTLTHSPHSPISLFDQTQLSRAYECFGRFLTLRPDLVAPLVSACMSNALLIPLDEPGHFPPPVPLTAAWKRKFDARLSMCGAVAALAKVSYWGEYTSALLLLLILCPRRSLMPLC